MTPIQRRHLLAALLAMSLPRAASAQRGPTYEHSELTIETATARHHFNIELADTDDRRANGLMFRTSMAPDAGMLFDFKADQPVAMWMRNTLIPLDMVFIARDGRIVNIAERTVPHSEASIWSDGPVRAVLELNGGTAQRLAIRPGDRVIHRMFRNDRS
jgi:uncharacterized membrane protein (UPF0127 family)